jgi:predicted lipid-binding transport protein (Tim44 family)
MDSGFQFFDILLFALVAVVILLRLRSTLGSRPDDNDDAANSPVSDWSARTRAEPHDEPVDSDNVINLPGQGPTDAPPRPSVDDNLPIEIAGGVAEVRLSDPHFDLNQFLEGAVFAYEMVMTAFAAAHYETLRQLLADSVYDDFAAALRHREERGESLETILIEIENAEPIEVHMNGRQSEITVKFAAQIINVLRDMDGEVLSGSADVPDDVVDIWTFTRDTSSNDPNWQILATRKAN